MPRSIAFATAPGLLLLACADGGEPSGSPYSEPYPSAAGPTVALVDSLLLEETEYYIGRPYSLSADTADGSFLIADGYSNRIFRFGRDGRFLQSYGHPGEGPGEFTGLSRAFILDDSTVVGTDVWRDLLITFSRDSGEPGRSVRCEVCTGGPPTVADGTVFLPNAGFADRRALAAWDVNEDTVRKIGPLPLSYIRSIGSGGTLAGVFGAKVSAAWSDTLMIGFAGANEMFLTDWDGEPFDTVHPPRARRRGVPSNAQPLMDEDMSLNFRDRIEMLSALDLIYRTASGHLVLMHDDYSFTGEQPLIEFIADIYVSVLSPDRKRLCADGPVRFANQLQAAYTVARDTLFLLDRTLDDPSGDMTSWIRIYSIDTPDCDWLPVE